MLGATYDCPTSLPVLIKMKLPNGESSKAAGPIRLGAKVELGRWVIGSILDLAKLAQLGTGRQ